MSRLAPVVLLATALATVGPSACSDDSTLLQNGDAGDDVGADGADVVTDSEPDGTGDLGDAVDGEADGVDVSVDVVPDGDAGEEVSDGGDAEVDTGPAGPFSVSGVVVDPPDGGVGVTLTGGSAGTLALVLEPGATEFAFTDALFEGDDYAVGVVEQPDDRYCWAGNGSGVMPAADVTDIAVVCTGAVEPVDADVPNQWLDFNVFPVGAPAVACAGNGRYVDCVHSGERRQVAVPGLTDCEGVTAADSAEAFVWTCDDSSGAVVVRSAGLDGVHGLLDLLDFEAAPAWRELTVEVADDGVPWARSQPGVWWTNPVVAATATEGVISPDEPGTIYVVSSDAAARVVFGAEQVAVVVAPGATLSAPAGAPGDSAVRMADELRFLWFEGDVDATDNDYGLHYVGARHSVVRNARIRHADQVGLYVQSGSGGVFADVEVADGADDGILVGSSGFWLFRVDSHDNGPGEAAGVGLRVGPSIFNTLSFVRAFDNGGDGIVIDGAYFMPLSADVRAFGNGGDGVVFTSQNAGGLSSFLGVWSVSNGGDGVRFEAGSVLASLVNVVSANNGGGGLFIDGGLQHRLATVLVTHNGGAGVRLSEAGDNRLADLTIASNLGIGLDLSDAIDNHVHQALVVANGNAGVRLRKSTHNVLSNLAVAGHTTEVSLDNNEPGFVHSPNLWVGELLLDEADCALDGDLVYGLDDTCETTVTGEGAPAFQLTVGLALDGLFVGAVPADDGGQAAFDAIDDWTAQERLVQTWGNAGPFGAIGVGKGPCTGGTCQLWDWRLDREHSDVFDAMALPDGAEAANWIVPYVRSNDATGQFLRSLAEFPGDGVGDDDLLCEPGECCLFTPHVGAWQGAGSLVVAGDFVDAEFGEVSMYAWDDVEGEVTPTPPCRFLGE